MSVQTIGQLTSSPADFRASPFPWPASNLGKKTNAIYGQKCYGLSENLRRVGLSLKTYLESCELPGTQFARTWSVKALTSGYLVLKLRLSERRIDAKGPSLWRTPEAEDSANRTFAVNSRGEPKLSAQVKLWPSPTTRDYRSADTNPSTKRFMAKSELNTAVKMFPTPTATVATHGGPNQRDSSGRPGLQMAAAMYSAPCAGHVEGTSGGEMTRSLRSNAGGQLNPAWVEWLMGFPIGWTSFDV